MQPFLILTGMHRSNTSMFGQILAQSGIRFGSSLVGPDQYNPYGHFEDQELVDLHEEVLASHGANWRPWKLREFPVSIDHATRFINIVQARQNDGDGVWGFKVPHATLLLPYWEEYDQAKFVLVFRSPEMVLRSLLRRVGAQIYYKPYYALNCLRTYQIYNELVLACYQRNRERAFLVNSDDLVASPSTVLAALSEKLDIPLVSEVRSDVVDRSVIGRRGGAYVEFLVRSFANGKTLQKCYADLDAACDTRAQRQTPTRQAA
jgi:hypothetical protein